MKYNLTISEYALSDIEDAIYWYESIHQSLGEVLKSSLFISLDYVEQNPLHFSKKYKEVRVKFIRRFPYGIHYLVKENEVKVVAFFHMKRDPKQWDKRLRK